MLFFREPLYENYDFNQIIGKIVKRIYKETLFKRRKFFFTDIGHSSGKSIHDFIIALV